MKQKYIAEGDNKVEFISPQGFKITGPSEFKFGGMSVSFKIIIHFIAFVALFMHVWTNTTISFVNKSEIATIKQFLMQNPGFNSNQGFKSGQLKTAINGHDNKRISPGNTNTRE